MTFNIRSDKFKTMIQPSLIVMLSLTYLGLTTMLSGCSSHSGSPTETASSSSTTTLASQAELGAALFGDTRLSLDNTQSCATCHDPANAFIDSRLDADGKTSAFSLGDNGISLGDRNTPTAAYASFSPPFNHGSRSRFRSQQPAYSGYLGGQFLDGRALDLSAQAGGPPLNPIEMAMPDKSTVVDRLKADPTYLATFPKLYGEQIFDDVEATYQAMAQAIAEFEKSAEFNAFDSKYDRSLRGEYQYDPLSKSAAGKALFFSQQFSNCATCHLLQPNSHPRETFSSYEYHNIGVPANTADRMLAGKSLDFVDTGLQAHPDLDGATELQGKFKVPTLRNIAVTGPYMHNGVFKQLRTVLEFYDHFLEGSEHSINRETGEPWAAPEVAFNISEVELQEGRKMTVDDIEALECFLRTLTDARYEHLLDDQGIACDE